MKVSARNQLMGKVKSIREGGVMAEVVVVIKSTEVMLGVDE